MSNPYLTHLAELRQLEARLDQRLDLIQKAEINLKSLLEALRNQVTGAYPVLNDLKTLVHQADQHVHEIRSSPEPDPSVESFGVISNELESAILKAKQDIDSFAAPLRQQMIDELRAVVQAAKSSIASMQASNQTTGLALEPGKTLDQVAEGFRIEAERVIESVRQKLMDQVDLLRAEAQLQIDPVLNQFTVAQETARRQITDLVEAHEKSLQKRIQQIHLSVQEISACLEERLTQRLESVRRRSDEALMRIETALNQHADQLLDRVQDRLQAQQHQLRANVESIYPRLDQQLQEIDRLMSDRMNQMEQHARSMSSYLEQKLTFEVDELIHRLRLKLQHEIATVTGTTMPVTRITHPDAPRRPEVEVEVFVGKKGKMPTKEPVSVPETEKMA